jgi:peptidoglycan/LPS O-acetylase OafA/YrhL
MTSRAGRLPLLDSLRALATLAILLVHTFGPSGVHANDALRPYSSRFSWPATVLMLLSAFLVYRPWVRAALDDRPWPSTRLYGWTRFVRVAPPYWVALTVTALWVTTGGLGVFTARGIPTYYGFAQIYWRETVLGGIAIAWFLCVLVVFYMFLPAYARLMRRWVVGDRRQRYHALLAGCLALIAVSVLYKVVISLAGATSNPAFSQLLPAYMDWLATGMAFAVLGVWLAGRAPAERRLPAPLRPLDRFPSLGLLLFALAYWAVAHLGIEGAYVQPGEHLQYLGQHTLYLAMALGLFLPLAFGNPRRGLTRRVLGSRPLLALSVISYGILLYHLAVIEQLKSWHFDPGSGVVSYVVWPIVTLALAIPLGLLSRLMIERPLQRLRPPGRLVPSRPPATATASADPPPTPATAAAD